MKSSSTSSQEIGELLDEFQKRMDRCKVLFEQYFLGIQKQAPMTLQIELERRIRKLTQMHITNTGLRFRFSSLSQRFSSYNTYWKRTMRQIEQGTYHRDIARLGRKAARTGADIPDEILAKMPKRMRDKILRDREAALKQQERRAQRSADAKASGKVLDNKPGNVHSFDESEMESLEDLDMDFLAEEVPLAMGQSLDGIGRVSKIVQAMRNFSHPGSMGQTPTDLNECLRNTITVSSSAWKYQAELELELAEDLRQVVCSESELNQVFLNLIVNSSHAIAARRTEDEPLGRIHVRTWNTAEGVGISIADDGCGMPPEVQKRMFEPFFTTKGVGEGTGQGLALAHNVLSAHGGSITVASQPGEGTTMTLLLPEGSK
mgnify:CR=1 FL=1